MEEKNKRTNTGLGQLQEQKGGSLCDTFVQLSKHLQAITGKYLRETFTKPLGMQTHLLSVFSDLFPSSHYLLLPTVSFSGQLSPADCSLLPSFVNWRSLSSLGPSFPLPLRSHAQALCVGFSSKQKRMLLIVSHRSKLVFSSLFHFQTFQPNFYTSCVLLDNF